MNSKWLLTFIAVLLLAVPTMVWAQAPTPGDTIIIESKANSPVNGACASAVLRVRVYVANAESMANITLVILEKNTSGTAYATLSRAAGTCVRTLAGHAFDVLYPNGPGGGPRLPTRSANYSGYNSSSRDSFLLAFTLDDPANDDGKLPPNPSRTLWGEIKFDSSNGLGTFELDSSRVLANTITFVNLPGLARKPFFTKGVITKRITPPVIGNCPPGPGLTVLYGRSISYTFTSNVVGTLWSVRSGPGSIDATGKYTFDGQCALGVKNITVYACHPLDPTACDSCKFNITIIDNPPHCNVAPPSVSGSVGSSLAATVTGTDPDAGDVTTLAKDSGPGVFDPATGRWTFTPGCGDVGTKIVVFQVTDGFPGPPLACAGHFSSQCTLTVTVTNNAPTVNCPPSGTVQAGNHYTANAVASDPDGPAPLTYSICGVVPAPTNPITINSATGKIDWDPAAADAPKCFDVCVQATDGCDRSGQCHFQLCVVSGQKFRLCIDVVHPPFQGGDVNVYVNNLAEAFDPSCGPNGNGCVGGFSFLFSYDCSCLQFLSAAKGSLLTEQRWEFFTYRFGALGNGNCGSGCPSCFIRVVAIADINNSNIHPAPCPRPNQGQWVCLRFRTTSDLRLAGLCCPINWYWLDCSDNNVSDNTGNCLWIACSLLTPDGTPINLATEFPTVNVANCDQVSGGPGKPSPKKFIVFCNGKICLPPLESLDARGDINLNGLSNEIADAVLFENYFIYGSGVFVINRNGQIAATDVNGDGRPLQVADLVGLIRIITGDANPLPRLSPAAGAVSLTMTSSASEVSISALSASDIGGLALKFKVNGTAGTPVLSEAAEGMSLKTNLVGNELSVLIFTDENHKNVRIAPNAGKILTVPVSGNVELVESDATDYYGISLPTLAKGTALPTSFGLSQNFPNPFNPKTSFVLALPVASEYSVTIYNVAGQAVKRFSGSAQAGNKVITWDGTDNNGVTVSSGIYFYKALAGKYSDVKRMMFLK